ncbi:MAG: hypothetical protein NC417_02845 [Candidatus Gastranaerophilales bacterium]|nr:hypothetical protein [Candidatus Gastranaerophilales bacterium]
MDYFDISMYNKRKEGFMVREEGYLNDLFYEDRPMRLIVPDPLQKVDEQELEQSRINNRDLKLKGHIIWRTEWRDSLFGQFLVVL